MIATEKDLVRIAVEVKTFIGLSDLHALENAVGQFAFYRSLMTRVDPERQLYLAVPQSVREGLLQEPIARPVLEDLNITVLAFDPTREVITTWKV